MRFWIARDQDGTLWLYNDIPQKLNTRFIQQECKDIMRLSNELFPEITFDNSPQEVEIKLTKQC